MFGAHRGLGYRSGKPETIDRRCDMTKFLVVICGMTLCTGVGGGVFFSRALGHSEAPPLPPIPPAQIGVEVLPLRWSWLHWWEANRSRYLVPARQAGVDQDTGARGRERMRRRAAKVLIEKLAAPQPEVRAASALALGRIDAADAMPGLVELARSDPDPTVRQRAITAIGLIAGPDAEALLLEEEYATAYLRCTALLSLGWLETPREGLADRLDSLMGGDALTVNAVSESMQALPGGWGAEQTKRTLERANSPWVVARTLGGIDKPDAQIDALLLDIASDGPKLRQVRAWRFLQQAHEDKRRYEGLMESDLTPQNIAGWWDAHDTVASLAPEPERPEGVYGLPPAYDLGPARSARKTVKGLEFIYQARLRAAAIVALGERGLVEAGPALRVALGDDGPYSPVPRAYAAVALGQIGDREAVASLIGLVAGERRGRNSGAALRVKRDDPLRGFAAIGLGLYARPFETEQGVVDRPMYLEAAEQLAATLLDKRQPVEVRAACAIALGLTGRTAYLRPMLQLSGGLDPTDDVILLGQILLARAMLGDRNVIDPARALLAAPPNRDEMSDLLGRRAAVLAMGLTGRDEAIPPLTEAWNETFYVNREVIYALSLSGRTGVGAALLERLEASDNHYEQAYMAQALGELLGENQPPRLAERFLAGREFTMKDGLLEDHRLLANRFLYEYLIPAFEEPWY